MTITKTDTRTKIALTVAVVLGAAGIAAAILPPLLSSEKKSEKVTASCGSYNQSVCLPCQKGLVQDDFRTCVCPRDEKWSGSSCVTDKKEQAVIVDPFQEQKFERGAAQVQLGSFRLMLNMHENASYTINLYGVAGVGGVVFTNVNIRSEEGFFVGKADGILENGKPITIQALNQGSGAFVGNGKRYNIYADVLKEAPLTSNTIYMTGDYNERIELGKFSITEPQSAYRIKIDSAKYGSTLGAEIKKEDKSPNAMIGVFGVTLPKGVDYVRSVTLSETKALNAGLAFEKFGLRVTDSNGKKLWNEEWVTYDPNVSNAFTFRGNGEYLFKGLPVETDLIFSVIATIKDTQKLPVNGKLRLSYIPADGPSQRAYFEGAHGLQEYSVTMVSGSEVSSQIKAERASSELLKNEIKQDEKSSSAVLGRVVITLPKGTDSLKRVLFREDKMSTSVFSKALNGFVLKAEVDGKTIGYSGTTYVDPKRGYIIFGDEAFGDISVLKGLPTDTKIILSVSGFVNNKEAFPVNGKLSLTYIQGAYGNEAQKTYFNNESKNPLELQEYSIKMAVPQKDACGDIGEKPCWSEYKGITIPEMTPYGCKKPLFLTDGLCQKQCVFGQKADGYKCYGSVIKLPVTECFAYETNPGVASNILWEQPSFSRCAKDLDPKKWEVAPWVGYKVTSTSATAQDPEVCYDEYRSVYKGVTSSRPNYMMYKKIAKSCR